MSTISVTPLPGAGPYHSYRSYSASHILTWLSVINGYCWWCKQESQAHSNINNINQDGVVTIALYHSCKRVNNMASSEQVYNKRVSHKNKNQYTNSISKETDISSQI